MPVDIILRLRGAAKFAADAARSAASVRAIGVAATGAAGAARGMGSAFGAAVSQAKYLSIGLGAVGVAGVKMGLSFNAQVESARLRFGLFTNDVDGLTKSVQAIDMKSAFNFGDLSDAAALFGNAGIKNIPEVLQASANAAAASGKGVEGFKSIAIALSQIASKGRLSQEEINQLNEAGAPGAQRIIADHFKLTAKQLQNLGGQGLDATEAIKALTDEWTSGKMAKAAEAQTKTLGGQWMLFTGNVQKLSGAATESLAAGLRDTALPAVNKAVTEITRIFGQEGLSNEAKLRQARAVIVRELGPVWSEISDEISDADIPEKLGKAVAAATPMILNAMADIAPKAAKAFVDGWMASGPEAKVITGLFLANKLRKSDFGKAILGGGKGSGKGGGGGWFTPAGRGSTPALPVFVAVVSGTLPGGGLPKKVAKIAKVGSAARLAIGAGGLSAAVAGGGILYLATTHNEDNKTRGHGASSPSNPAGSIAPPGFGNSGGIQQTVINVDGRRIATAMTPYTQIETARGLAAAAARK